MPQADVISASVVVNPTSGRGHAGRLLSFIHKELVRHGVDTNYTFTEKHLSHVQVTERALRSNPDVIVIVGGDGTLHGVVNGLFKKTRRDIPVALIPTGTGNDFARAAFGKIDVEAACRAVRFGKIVPTDIGLATTDASEEPICFIVGCGVGLVADVADIVNNGVRIVRGAPAYLIGVVKAMQAFVGTAVEVTIDNGIPEGFDSSFLAISNTAYTGGGMLIAPGASIWDGKLNVCAVRKLSKARLLQQLPGIFVGAHVRHPKTSTCLASSVTIKMPKEGAFWIDGETMRAKSIRVHVSERKLQLLVLP
jgi:YegS/Rv2252/BmrU family lipid kinase